MLNANGPDEIAFVPSDGAGFTKVFWGLLLGNQIAQGDRVLVDRINYSSHYLALLQARDQFDLRIDVIPSLVDGSIDLDGLDRMLGDDLDQDVGQMPVDVQAIGCDALTTTGRKWPPGGSDRALGLTTRSMVARVAVRRVRPRAHRSGWRVRVAHSSNHPDMRRHPLLAVAPFR